MRTWSLRILRQVFRLALSALHWLTVAMVTTFKSRTALQVENLALRHQLAVLRRSVKRSRVTSADRLFWAWLSRCVPMLAAKTATNFFSVRQSRPRFLVLLDASGNCEPNPHLSVRAGSGRVWDLR